MNIVIGYPPIKSEKGIPLLAQNRQFQWFNSPTYIFPVVPAQMATLLKSNGHQVTWLDGIAEEMVFQNWLGRLVNLEPDMLVMETKTPVVKQHWLQVAEIKRWLPATQMVMVGDHVTALPEETMKACPVDTVVTGGDYDFLVANLCEYLEGKSPLDGGIYYRQNGEVKNTGSFILQNDLNKMPLIDRDLVKWELYAYQNGNFRRTPGTYTMAGRDCWHGECTFCSWTTLYTKWRLRTPDDLLDEVGHLIDSYGVVEIMDDSGSFPTGQWLRRFCQGMIERGYNQRVTLDCNMRFGACSAQDFALMREAGFRFLLFGLESANEETLQKLNKHSSGVKRIVEDCRAATRAGLKPHITIMFGYPWEGREEAARTVELGTYLLKKGMAYTMQSTVVIPYPGTPLYQECVENGWLLTDNWDRFDMREPVMKTPMDPEEVMELVQDLYKVSYHPEFLVRKLLSIRDFDDVRFFARAGKQVVGHLNDFSS
jgi:anaerobic magnesium-protoporphyrin IX monomethyl ester cyclase